MFKIMFTIIFKAIAMFRVEKGSGLIINAWLLLKVVFVLAGLGCERRENRATISDPITNRTVTPLEVRWKKRITGDFADF